MLPDPLPRLIKTIRTNDGHGEEVIGRAEPAGWDIALLGGFALSVFFLFIFVCLWSFLAVVVVLLWYSSEVGKVWGRLDVQERVGRTDGRIERLTLY